MLAFVTTRGTPSVAAGVPVSLLMKMVVPGRIKCLKTTLHCSLSYSFVTVFVSDHTFALICSLDALAAELKLQLCRKSVTCVLYKGSKKNNMKI